MNKLFIDCKTDEEKYNFFLSGQGYETGVIAASIQNDVAMSYKRCVSFQDELRRLHEVNQELMKALKNIASTSSLPTDHHVAAARWALTEIAKTAIAKAEGESK
jgi:hypothetical protein